MKLVACYCTYNNFDYLRASLETIHPHVDQIIIVDGRFENYPGKSNISTDGTLQVALDYQKRLGEDKVIILPPKLYFDEIEKRNAYLDHLSPGDWLFIIDGDEIPFGYLDLLKGMLAQEKGYVVNVLEYDFDITTCDAKRRPRLVRKIDGMEYAHNHYSIMHDGKNVFLHEDYTEKRVYPVQIIHMVKYRDKKVEEEKKDYRAYLKASEEVPIGYEKLHVRDGVDFDQLVQVFKEQQKKQIEGL